MEIALTVIVIAAIAAFLIWRSSRPVTPSTGGSDSDDSSPHKTKH